MHKQPVTGADNYTATNFSYGRTSAIIWTAGIRYNLVLQFIMLKLTKALVLVITVIATSVIFIVIWYKNHKKVVGKTNLILL